MQEMSCSRLALTLYAIVVMGGCWLVEQPSTSFLRYHPRVMEAFSGLRVSWSKAEQRFRGNCD